MAYNAWSVVFGEQPAAAKWNQLGTNDAGFRDSSNLVLNTGTSATVVTSQTTTSATYADLATVGPAATVTIGASGKALVTITASVANNTNGQNSLVAAVVSGANTISGATNEASGTLNLTAKADNQAIEGSHTRLYTGLTAGSTTFTLQYRTTTASTGTFARRWISVIPL